MYLDLYISIIINILNGSFLKNIIFSCTKPEISTSLALTYTKLHSFIYIMKIYIPDKVKVKRYSFSPSC